MDKGSWQGVSLDGLSVVGVVKASATLGDPFASPYPAKAVMIVDEKATADSARGAGGVRPGDGRRHPGHRRPDRGGADRHERRPGRSRGQGLLQAGELAQVETRAVSAKDKHCGNEDVYYPPLTSTDDALPAVAIVDKFSGEGLGVSWTTHDKRNAFVGTLLEVAARSPRE